MSMHLFSTPVQCTNCGTVVDDPKQDHCPNCQALLRERRTPSRVAGVEKRYGGLRALLNFLRFLGIITLLLGVLVFAYGLGDERVTVQSSIMSLVATVVGAVVILAVSAFFEVVLDMEENTRAGFRVQQMMLEHMQETAGRTEGPHAGVETQAS